MEVSRVRIHRRALRQLVDRPARERFASCITGSCASPTMGPPATRYCTGSWPTLVVRSATACSRVANRRPYDDSGLSATLGSDQSTDTAYGGWRRWRLGDHGIGRLDLPNDVAGGVAPGPGG